MILLRAKRHDLTSTQARSAAISLAAMAFTIFFPYLYHFTYLLKGETKSDFQLTS